MLIFMRMKIKKNKYWFKPRIFGFGFTPVSWEGWLGVLFMLIVILLDAYVRGLFEAVVVDRQGFGFLIDIFVISTLSSLVFKYKTKGKLRWRWGK